MFSTPSISPLSDCELEVIVIIREFFKSVYHHASSARQQKSISRLLAIDSYCHVIVASVLNCCVSSVLVKLIDLLHANKLKNSVNRAVVSECSQCGI